MARGTNQQNQSRIFMKVAFGKFRQKTQDNGQEVNENTKGAIKRTTQQGQDSWAIEYDNVSGYIQNIFYKSNEGTKFPATFEVVIKDADEILQISFNEDSRFWFGFMEVLPNIQLQYPVTINVYDYVNKAKDRKVGISVEQPGNPDTHEVTFSNKEVKDFVNSFYKEYIEESKTWKFLHGYPVPAKDINWKDRDDTDIYYKGVKKFLRNEFSERFDGKFNELPNHQTQNAVETPVDNMTNTDFDSDPGPGEDDLPY